MIKRAYHWWRDWINHWHGEIVVLVELFKHPKIPKLAKVIVFVLLSYIFSPLDLIPDFIPFIGHVDDFLMIPLTFWLINKITPVEIILEVRARVEADPHMALFKGWGPKIAAVFVLVIWILISWWTLHLMGLDGEFSF